MKIPSIDYFRKILMCSYVVMIINPNPIMSVPMADGKLSHHMSHLGGSSDDHPI
jgi:hypothetical protein